MLDIALVGPPQGLALLSLEEPHRFQSPREHHGRQRSGEDEAGSIGAHHVHQVTGASDVAAHTAKGLAWRQGGGRDAQTPFSFLRRLGSNPGEHEEVGAEEAGVPDSLPRPLRIFPARDRRIVISTS